ncbi:MAG: PAS domain-containing protein [Bryobacteraceae bacterium]
MRKSQEGILLVTPKMMVLRLVHAAFGHSDADVAGQSVLLFIHPDDRDRFQQVFSRLLDGQSRTATCQSRVRNPREIWAPAEIEMTDLLDDPQVQAIVFNYRAI